MSDDMQAIAPCAAWVGCTPVPMQQLYSSLLEGRLELRVQLANGQAPESIITLRRLLAMPIQQHLQLQVCSKCPLHSSSRAAFCSFRSAPNCSVAYKLSFRRSCYYLQLG